MAYRTILTLYGRERLSEAVATGTSINLTHMAVGDGGGHSTTPSETQTQLVREVFRAPVNRVFQDSEDPTKFLAELIIPAADGGFVVREAGIFDDAGGLFAVANTPDTYKPTPAEGAFSDAALRMAFISTNASVVTLQVDPNVAVATHQWVINNITAAKLIPGGTTGQLLAKASNQDGDYVWKDPTDANVVVDVIEEPQTLADGQTTVIWSIVTTRGLAVYIEGVRIEKGPGPGQWMEDPTQPDTRIILGKAYPAGTTILGTQNEPTGSVPFPLIRDQNLADVPNKAQGRANLDVFSRAETRQMAQPGLVGYYARTTAPAGWLKANGAAVSRTAYADLFAVIGTTYGAGDGFSTFNLPDLRGEFIRGWSDGRNVDAGRVLGSTQASQNLSHNHSAFAADTTVQIVARYAGDDGLPDTGITLGPVQTGFIQNNTIITTNVHNHAISVGNEGGTEARPRNVALLACIKF